MVAKKQKANPVVAVLESPPTILQLKRVLKQQGFDVVDAFQVKDFFTPRSVGPRSSEILTDRASLFIINSRLPDGPGLDVIERLKQSRQWKKTPIIMTGHEAVKETVFKALKLGVKDFVLKPFRDDDILYRIMAAIDPPSASGEMDGPSVTHTFEELIKLEISRSRRADQNFSIVLAGFELVETPSEKMTAKLTQACNSWTQKAATAINSHLRDIDTALCFDSCKIGMLLPLTAANGLGIVEGRVQFATQATLEKMAANRQLVGELLTGSATYPEDGKSLESLMMIAAERLNDARRRTRIRWQNSGAFDEDSDIAVQKAA